MKKIPLSARKHACIFDIKETKRPQKKKVQSAGLSPFFASCSFSLCVCLQPCEISKNVKLVHKRPVVQQLKAVAKVTLTLCYVVLLCVPRSHANLWISSHRNTTQLRKRVTW